MPIEFYELPQGSPSIVPVAQTSTAVAYCTASDAASLNKARAQAIGTDNQPTLTDLDGYVLMVAGQMDAIMTTKGYQTPVNVASYPDAAGFLNWVNAQGAAYLLEESAPAPHQAVLDRLKAAYDNAIAMLSDGKFSMDVPDEPTRAEVRAPWITWQPSGQYYDPSLAGDCGDGISSANANGRRQDPYFVRNLMW